MQATQLLITFATRPDGALIYRQYAGIAVNINDEILAFLALLIVWLETGTLILGDFIRFVDFQIESWGLVLVASWYVAINDEWGFRGCYCVST